MKSTDAIMRHGMGLDDGADLLYQLVLTLSAGPGQIPAL